MKKRTFLILLAVFVALIFIFFLKNNYKKIKIGNNESNKSVKDVEEYILNINSYTAVLDVTINSNKNSNKYILEQEYRANNIERQKVLKPENIEGTEIIYKDGNIEINNSSLNLSKMYSNYPYLSDNVLCLNSFIENYKNNRANTSIYEEYEYIVMQVDKEENNYIYTKKLYLEKGTGTPKKMVVQDNNKKDIIYILYTEMNINK